MKVVTQNDIKKINQLYCELKTYAAVARITGFSPATVKKYIIPNFQTVDETKIIRFDKPLPTNFDNSMFRVEDWGPLCVLTREEQKDVIALWAELEV